MFKPVLQINETPAGFLSLYCTSMKAFPANRNVGSSTKLVLQISIIKFVLQINE